MKESFVRFSRRQRVEHFLVMSLFIVLAVDGLPAEVQRGRLGAAPPCG